MSNARITNRGRDNSHVIGSDVRSVRGADRNLPEARPSRRDWIIMPLLSLATALALVGGAEILARIVFHTPKTSTLACLVLDDPDTGVRGRPNTTCTQYKWETPGPVVYRFNSSGHRAGMEMLPKPPDTFRIVLVGSSMAVGLWVPWQQTLAAQLPGELYRLTGRSVQLYDEGMQWGTPRNMARQFNNVIAAKPDLILWVVTPWDMSNVDMNVPPDSRKLPLESGWAAVQEFANTRVRFLFLLRHLLYLSQSEFLRHFLMQGKEAAFLQADPSPAWQDKLEHFRTYAAEMEKQAKTAGVPLVVTALPERAQTDMISTG